MQSCYLLWELWDGLEKNWLKVPAEISLEVCSAFDARKRSNVFIFENFDRKAGLRKQERESESNW